MGDDLGEREGDNEKNGAEMGKEIMKRVFLSRSALQATVEEPWRAHFRTSPRRSGGRHPCLLAPTGWGLPLGG